MEQEEEPGYHTNYSPSPPQQEQYSPPQQRGYHSDEYESLEPESSPPLPPSHKDVRHAKSNRELGKKRRNRNEEPHQHNAKIGCDQGAVERKKPNLESPVQKSSKQTKKSTTHERKAEEKKKKEEGN